MLNTLPRQPLSQIRQAHNRVVAEYLDPLARAIPSSLSVKEQTTWLIEHKAFHLLLHPKALQNFALFYLNSHMAYGKIERPPVPDTKAHLSKRDFSDGYPVRKDGQARKSDLYPMTREDFKKTVLITRDPLLQQATLILQDMVGRYCQQTADFIDQRYDSRAVGMVGNHIMNAVNSNGIWIELMPFISLDLNERGATQAPRDGDALSQAFADGNRRARHAEAFTAETIEGVRTCPFKTPLKHMLEMRFARPDDGPWTTSPHGQRLIAVIYNEYLADRFKASPDTKPAQILG